jgi:DNA-binding NarL/FixJ family response regulator
MDDQRLHRQFTAGSSIDEYATRSAATAGAGLASVPNDKPLQVALYHPAAMVAEVMRTAQSTFSICVRRNDADGVDQAAEARRAQLLIVGTGSLHSHCELIAAMRAESPQLPVIALVDDGESVVECAMCRADAVCSTQLGIEHVADIVHRTLMNVRSIVPRPTRRTRPRARVLGPRSSDTLGALTRREREVLAMVMEGLGTSEIAAEVGITASTARSHVKSVLSKLGAHTRLQLVALVSDLQAVGHDVLGHASLGEVAPAYTGVTHRDLAQESLGHAG